MGRAMECLCSRQNAKACLGWRCNLQWTYCLIGMEADTQMRQQGKSWDYTHGSRIHFPKTYKRHVNGADVHRAASNNSFCMQIIAAICFYISMVSPGYLQKQIWNHGICFYISIVSPGYLQKEFKAMACLRKGTPNTTMLHKHMRACIWP